MSDFSDNVSDDDFEVENLPKKKQAALAKPKGPRKALQPTTAHNEERPVEEIYQKKTQLEHILLRPDTYVGSTERQQQKLWVHDGQSLVYREITYVPGLYKIFDEILVNAADNKVRDPKMDTVKVDIDVAARRITVWNNGDGVPVEMHKEENVYVPELIFGHLLTSSNYNDNEKKVTGGRNGYGAKLANIFSTEFIIETCDGRRLKRYRQVFTNNMTSKEKPQIKACKASENWTCVSFCPDLAKFGMEELEDDTVALMRKRVYDLAGVLGKGVKVFFNGEKLPVSSFAQYVDLYIPDKSVPRVHEVCPRWEIFVTASEGQFQQVSFVNSICTIKGGTHVNYIVDQIAKSLTETINKKDKKANVKPFMVKNYLSVFINCMIENPAFDSQTKETLTLRQSSFGSKVELPPKFMNKVAECGVLEGVLSFASHKQDKAMKKSDGAKRQRITGLPKLMDANDAGGRNSEDCTLILTEGDSAKSLVVAGLSVGGRDRYGVFPLRGKLLNVRDASATQITSNAEIQNIKQILGLQHGKVYESTKQLRYGHLMIMTDQDHDGSHIKGLIMNFIHHFYPSLMKIPGFLLEFITPIVKVTKGKKTLAFYTLPEYEAWKESTNTAGWSVKYYKGLGTSTEKEAKEYFAALDDHKKQFVWTGEHDGQAIELAFSKKKVEDRKQWLLGFAPGTYLDQSVDEIPYVDFINKELILFSRADLERSIPNMVDGFKPGQRKILFCCFKRNLKSDVKVAQLAGYVSEHSAYHHGEQSLQSTIVGLAQNYVGSNNINLLVPQGQFGTRLMGGKDAASARYIFTRLEKITRTIFHEADDKLLNYLTEEGQSIEPSWYMPVIPMVLVNGAEGIGTGWSTTIPNYNPRDIVSNTLRLLNGEEVIPMQPWYKGFKGTIQEIPSKTAGKSYLITGVITQVDDNTLEITELPVRKWTQDYKEFLETLIKPEDKAAVPILADYKENHTDKSVHFTLQLAEGKMNELLGAGLESKFKLTTKMSTGNMVLFDAEGRIRRYQTAEDILLEFFSLRLEYYSKRRDMLIKAAEFELLKLSNKARFILAVVSGTLVVSNRRKADIESDLDMQGFVRIAPTKKSQTGAPTPAEEEESEEDLSGAAVGTFDYLLSMQIYSLTLEKVEALKKEEGEAEMELQRIKQLTPQEMYRIDLQAFVAALELREAEEAADEEEFQKQRKQAGKGKKGKAARKKKAASDESDIDMVDDSDDDFVTYVPKARPAGKRAAVKPAPSKSKAQPGSKLITQSREDTAPPVVNTDVEVVSVPAPDEASSETSLLDRLAGRMKTLSVDPNPKPAGGRGKAKGGPKANDCAVPGPSESAMPLESDTAAASTAGRVNAKPSGQKEKAAPKRKPAAPSTKARSKNAAVNEEVDSPAPAPTGKVRRMRPSPFHKGSGATKEAAPKPSKLGMAPFHETIAEEVTAVPAADALPARPARHAASKKKAYVVDSDSGEEDSDDIISVHESEDSDFSLSD